MPAPDPTDAPPASWSRLERAVERLHASARTARGVREFYRVLVDEAAAAIGASGGAAWQPRSSGTPELICRTQGDDAHSPSPAVRRKFVEACLASGEAAVHPTSSAIDESPRGPTTLCVVCPVRSPGDATDSALAAPIAAIIELLFPAGATPLAQEGWIDFALTVADVASDFHALHELRSLREGATLRRQAVDLLSRIGQPRTVAGAAFEIANEGRRLLECDRLSVIVRRGGRWRLAATSGVDAVQRRTQFARLTERLADHVARWGEPLSHPELDESAELPPRLAEVVAEHADHSHARQLACAPISFATAKPAGGSRVPCPAPPRPAAVLVAERFEGGNAAAGTRQLVELGELCGPALARAAELDRFPIRTLLRWSAAWNAPAMPRRLARMLTIGAVLAAIAAALVFVPADYDVEAPATLVAAVERDVFATASGAVAEVRVVHGQTVHQGDVLVVLVDPDLALKLQQTRGEIESTRKQLDSLAVTRTERTLREETTTDRLPIAAEQRQLEERLATLEGQLKLLEERRESLTLRSPLDGQVLTRDVQSLLESRPVERGQALLTIADASSGWQLVAETPQRKIGAVLDAQHDLSPQLPVSYRLAGDVDRSYPGHVVAVSAAATLDPEGFEDEAPPVQVRIAVDGAPPEAARSGMTASVRIHCGQRPLGYVWLYDVGATLYRWATF